MMSREGRVHWLSEECAGLSPHSFHQSCLVPTTAPIPSTMLQEGKMPTLGWIGGDICVMVHQHVFSEPVLALRSSVLQPYHPALHPLGQVAPPYSSSLELPLQVDGSPLDPRSPAVLLDDCSLPPPPKEWGFLIFYTYTSPNHFYLPHLFTYNSVINGHPNKWEEKPANRALDPHSKLDLSKSVFIMDFICNYFSEVFNCFLKIEEESF